MTFSFTSRSNVKDQVRRIAVAQIEAGIAECQPGADLDKTVHGLRRRCKKLRGLLRLIEPQSKVFEAENRVVRDAAQGLAGTRDAAVMVETFNGLVDFDGKRDTAPLDATVIHEVRAMLRHRVIGSTETIDGPGLLANFAAAMTPVAERARTWPIKGQGFACLGAGLERTYGRMREGIAHALDEGSAEALHDWRKHTKYHWHHMSLLHRAAPQLLRGRRDLLDQLGELLGDHHNLHVLGETLAEAPEPISADGVEAIGGVIADRQALLASRAFELGRQLTVEKPAVLRRRFEQYWQLLPEAD